MNYYLTAIEGMPKLLDCCAEPLPYFKKTVYPDAFKRLYCENTPTFDAVENGYNMVIDKDQFLTNMANALSEHAAELLNGCRRKGDRERMMMDLNMAMAVFVIPMVLEYKGKSSQPFSEKLLASWKERFPKSTLQAADYEFIEKGFHKKFCYITTAVCETFGRPDDCYELTLLRDYRDGYLSSRPDGESLIHEYYDVAPTIVKHINQQENSGEIYQSIWEEYLAPCVDMIEHGELEACEEHYKDMVHTLQKKYFYQ